MRKLLLILPILLMLTSAPAKPQLGIAVGDSFTFTLSQWDVTEDGTPETVATVTEEGINTFTLKEGDTFTVTIISIDDSENPIDIPTIAAPSATATPDQQTSTAVSTVYTTTAYTSAYTTTATGGPYYDYAVLVEYSSGSQTIQTYEYVGWGGFIVDTDWDQYRSMLDQTPYSDSDTTTSYSIIDTADEFGIKSSYSYTDTYGDNTYTSHDESEVRYKKSDGVITYLHFDNRFTRSNTTTSETSTTNIEIYRSGYSPSNTNGDISLPGFQGILLITVFVFIYPIRRRFMR